MEKKRITVLELKDKERLELREAFTSYFRQTGRYSVYLMDPVIVLGPETDIRKHVSIISPFTLTGEVRSNEYGTYLEIGEKDMLYSIQSCLGLASLESGVHLDMEKDPLKLTSFPAEVRIGSIALAEYSECTFRILYRRKLSMGR